MPKRSGLNVLSLLQGRARASSACTSSAAASDNVIGVEDPIESASEAEALESAPPPTESKLAFCVSRSTCRVHVLDGENENAFGCNFKLADWEARRDPQAVFSEA